MDNEYGVTTAYDGVTGRSDSDFSSCGIYTLARRRGQ